MKPKTFALITAAVVGGTGLAGLVQSKVSPQSKGKRGTSGRSRIREEKIAGMVPTNTLFNWVRLGIGAAGLVCSRSEKASVMYNRGVAISYVGMGIMGVIPKTETMFGLMPLYGANVALHGGIAAAELLTEKELMASAKNLLPFGAKRNEQTSAFLS